MNVDQMRERRVEAKQAGWPDDTVDEYRRSRKRADCPMITNDEHVALDHAVHILAQQVNAEGREALKRILGVLDRLNSRREREDLE